MFDRRIDTGLNQVYGELKFLEHEITAVATDSPISLKVLLERLDNIAPEVVAMDLPDEY